MSNVVLLDRLYMCKYAKTVGGYPFRNGEVVETKIIHLETGKEKIIVNGRIGRIEIEPSEFIKNFVIDSGNTFGLDND